MENDSYFLDFSGLTTLDKSKERNIFFHYSDRDNIPPKSETDLVVVLDLDETLIHAFDDPNELIGKKNDRIFYIDIVDAVTPKGSGVINHIAAITRPYLKEFLIFCFSFFRIVAIWSAGQKRYVEAAVNYICRDIRDPQIIFTYNQCEIYKKTITKPLIKMISSHSKLKDIMSLKNTFIVDDRKTAFIYHNIKNGILIPPYSPDVSSLDAEDTSLLKLMYWFKNYATNISDITVLYDKKLTDEIFL